MVEIGYFLSALAFIVSYNTFFGMCFLVSTFVLFLIKERATKAKHIQVRRIIELIELFIVTLHETAKKN